MLAADKQALQSMLKKNALEIREKELTFFVNNFAAVAGQAAMLAGFSFTGLFMEIDAEKPLGLRIAFYCITACAFGLMMVSVANSLMCNVFGPGLALRGPEGSMHQAVENMQRERMWNFAYYGVGLLCFHLSGILLAWLKFDLQEAAVVSALLSAFLLQFVFMGRRLYVDFKIHDDEVETGQIVFGDSYIPDADPSKLRKCSNCTKTLATGVRFCPGCGLASDSRAGSKTPSMGGSEEDKLLLQHRKVPSGDRGVELAGGGGDSSFFKLFKQSS